MEKLILFLLGLSLTNLLNAQDMTFKIKFLSDDYVEIGSNYQNLKKYYLNDTFVIGKSDQLYFHRPSQSIRFINLDTKEMYSIDETEYVMKYEKLSAFVQEHMLAVRGTNFGRVFVLLDTLSFINLKEGSKILIGGKTIHFPYNESIGSYITSEIAPKDSTYYHVKLFDPDDVCIEQATIKINNK